VVKKVKGGKRPQRPKNVGPPTARQARKIARNKARRAGRVPQVQNMRRAPSGRGGPRKGLVDVVGGRGEDMSAAATTGTEGKADELRVASVQMEMPITATINNRSLVNLAIGAVLLAIKHGWMSGIRQGEQPYYAAVYIYNVLLTALTTAPPLNTGAPIWLWNILAALKPKRGNFKTGTADYSWVIQNTLFPLLPITQYSTFPTSSIMFGTPDPHLTVNGYPQLVIPAIPYTDELGAESFVSLCRFLPAGPLNQIVTETDVSMMTADTSAFAVSFPELGNSLDTTGALAQTIYSERNIDSPLLSKFAIYQPLGEYYRGWIRAGKSAGSPMYIIPRMSEMEDLREVKDKVSPVFAFYNFDEFFYLLSIIVGRAMELLSQTDGGTIYPPCPLTPQVVQFLLRQTIIGIFANHMGQDLYLSSSSSSLYTMVPFCVGPNGVAFTGSKMQLPTIFTENVRCSQRKIKTLQTKAGQSVFDIVSILARPAQQPQLQNFVATVAGEPVSIYATDPLEVPTNLIDCSYQSGSAVTYFSPTGALIEEQMGIWNEWITGLSGNLSPLVPFSTEGGISALLTTLFTRSQVNNSDAIRARRKLEAKTLANSPQVKPKELSREEKYKMKFEGMRKKVSVVPEDETYINMNIEKETISNQPPTAPVWKYMSLFILPVFLTQAEQDEGSLQTWMVFQVQPYTIPSNTVAGGEGNLVPTVFPSIASRLDKFASLDTKANNQQQNNEMVEELAEMARQGRGGFFADVAAFLGNTFVPGTGSAIHAAVESWGG